MSPNGTAAVLALALGAILALPVTAQEPSLGEAAQREKDRRARSGRRAAGGKVYTNDDLEAARQAGAPRGNLNIMDGQVDTGSSSESPPEGAADDRSSEGSGDEAQWRERARQVRGAVATAQGELTSRRQEADRLREQLSPMAQPYLQDANQRLRLQAELTEAERGAARAQGELTEARARLQDLLEEARQQRVPASWVSDAS